MTSEERDNIRRRVEVRVDFMVQTFFASTMEMSGPEMGLYLVTLHYAWTNGARLPADEDRLRRTLRYDKDEWVKVWPTVLPKWTKDGSYLKNSKLSILYAAAWERMEVAVKKGREGGNAAAANARASADMARGPYLDP